MIKETYRHIIFTDNVRKLKKELKNKNSNIFVGSINDADGYGGLMRILDHNGFNCNSYARAFMKFLNLINLLPNTKYNCVYIIIKNINDFVNNKYYNIYYKLNFFNLLNNITNKQIYFIIDIKYKDYVFNQIEEYNKHINRLRSFGEIHNQVIFVDDIEKVKQDVSNKETEMFKEIDGNKCKDIDLFYDQLIDGWKFPDYFARNFGALDDWINDTFEMWYGFKESDCSAIFHYIKDFGNMLPNDASSLITICDLLYEVYNMRMFYLIDKKDKDYFLEQVEISKKY